MTFRAEDLESFRRMVRGAHVLVSTHLHPDPDAIGSALAASDMLGQMGAGRDIIIADPIPPRMQWLPGAHRIISLPATGGIESYAVAVIVDAADLQRIGDVEARLAPGALVANIDHHVSNHQLGLIRFVGVEYAATAEILYDLCKSLGLTITSELATNLYAGLLTDTGRFRFSNTSARTLEVATDLVRLGADATEITNRLYYDLPAQDVRSIGAIFSTLTLYGNGTVSMLTVRRENVVEDPDSVVDAALSIRGVELAAMLTEAPDDRIRISLRSRSFVNVSRIAEHFGGGGHERAAGFRMHGDLESVRKRILPTLLEATQVGVPNNADAEV